MSGEVLSVTVGALAGTSALAHAICLKSVARGAVFTAAVMGVVVTTVTRVVFHKKLESIAETGASPGKAPRIWVTVGIAVAFVVIASIVGRVAPELMSTSATPSCQVQEQASPGTAASKGAGATP